VGWSPTGAVLAAGFGKLDHGGWCKHKAGVCVWAMWRRRGGAGDTPDDPVLGPAPDLVLESSSCVCSLAFHPENPALVAAGTYSGEVMVWDTSRAAGGEGKGAEDADPLVAKSRVDDYFHRDPVNALSWVWEPVTKKHVLTSVSGDGKALVWSLDNALAYPIAAFQLTARIKPSAHLAAALDDGGGDAGDDDDDDDAGVKRRLKRRGAAQQQSLVGGSAVCFPLDGRGIASFVVGTEAGGVYRGATDLGFSAPHVPSPTPPTSTAAFLKAVPDADNSMPWDIHAAECVRRIGGGAEQKKAFVRGVERAAREAGAAAVTMAVLYDARPDPAVLFRQPLNMTFSPHTGAVLSAASSPFNRNLFATAGADGTVAVFSALAGEPLLRLEPAANRAVLSALFSVAWSKKRPMVFAAGSSDGCSYVYDLYASTTRPALVLRPDGSVANAQGTLMAAPNAATVSIGSAAAAGAFGGAGSGGATPAPSAALRRGGTDPSRPVLGVAFNPKHPRLLAAGDGTGTVRVWKLTWKFGSVMKEEPQILRDFVTAALGDEAANAVLSDDEGAASPGGRGAAAKKRGDDDDDDDASAANSMQTLLQKIALSEAKAKR
jgi:WD40 repeat protein